MAAKKHSEKAALEFTEMMELFLDSGLSVRDALEALSRIDSNAAAGIGKRLLGHIRRGASFAQATELMDDCFPPMYRGMIRVGNAVGSMEKIFKRLSAYLRDKKKIRDAIYGAMAYPALVLAVAVLGTLGLLFFVMPKMELIFAGFGGNAGDTIRKNVRSMELALGIAAAVAALAPVSLGLLRKNSFIDRLLLALPLAGKFISSWETFNFAFAMEALTGGGISVEDAIREAAGLASNEAYRQALFQARERVLKGGSLAKAFLENPIFPPDMGRWIEVGERAGKTEQVFAQLRSYFQGELERRTSKIVLLMEPAMIAVIGALILALVAGILLPLFTAYGTIL
jgi:type II secretory pathway component PulF